MYYTKIALRSSNQSYLGAFQSFRYCCSRSDIAVLLQILPNSFGHDLTISDKDQKANNIAPNAPLTSNYFWSCLVGNEASKLRCLTLLPPNAQDNTHGDAFYVHGILVSLSFWEIVVLAVWGCKEILWEWKKAKRALKKKNMAAPKDVSSFHYELLIWIQFLCRRHAVSDRRRKETEEWR